MNKNCRGFKEKEEEANSILQLRKPIGTGTTACVPVCVCVQPDDQGRLVWPNTLALKGSQYATRKCAPQQQRKRPNLTQVELEEERRGFSDIDTQCRNYTSVFSTNSNSPLLPVAWPSISSSSRVVLLCSASAVQCFLYNRNGPIFFLLPKSAVPF